MYNEYLKFIIIQNKYFDKNLYKNEFLSLIMSFKIYKMEQMDHFCPLQYLKGLKF